MTEEVELARVLHLLAICQDAALLVDCETHRCVGANRQAIELLGCKKGGRLAAGSFREREGNAQWRRDVLATWDGTIDRFPQAIASDAVFHHRDGSEIPLTVTRQALRIAGRWQALVTARPAFGHSRVREQAEHLSFAMNEAADALQLVDTRAMTYESVNGAAARLFGLSRERMIALGPIGVGREIEKATADAVRARYDEAIARCPEAVRGMREFQGADGGTRTIEYTRRATRRGDGWLVAIAERDVTERMADQRRLKQMQAALNDSDAFGVIDVETLTYVDLNEAAARLFGGSREEMMKLGPAGYLRDVGEDALAANLRRIYAEVIARYPEAMSEIVHRKRRDGTMIVLHTTRRALQVDGRWLIVGVNRDITERYAATQRLERLVAAMNEAADAVQVIDPQAMAYEDVNVAAARLFGMSREQMIAMGPVRVGREIEQASPESVSARYDEAIARYPEAVNGMREVMLGGSARTMEFTRRAVRFDDRWLIVSVERDVTARVRAESELHVRMEELARSNRDLEQFAYVTSHDLSEPLRMVSSYTQLLGRRYSAQFDEDGREFMGFIVDGTRRMKRLIDDLLAYSRAGRPNTALRQVALDKLLDEALANLEHAINESKAQILRPAALPKLACNETGMSQVFQNLIANAIKFKGETPPAIRIEAQQDGMDWTFSVADNGIGIEPQHFERIFLIFQRLHARTAYEGTGIGLSICKKIVERHGGSIWVESEPGQGTCFKFKLPATPAQTQ